MSIIELRLGSTGNQGVGARRCQLISNDILATVESPGYIPSTINVKKTDIFDVWYGDNAASYAVFVTSRDANGIITLSTTVSPGDVNLPVVNGNIAIFQGTAGAIGDSSISFTSTSFSKVPTLAATTYTVSNLAVFYDAAGSLKGGAGSEVTQINSPSTATPANYTFSSGTQLSAASITSGVASGGRSFLTCSANSGADLSAHTAVLSATGNLGATSVTSVYRSELNLGANVLATGSILTNYYAQIDSTNLPTGSRSNYSYVYGTNKSSGAVGSSMRFDGLSGTVLSITNGGACIGTPGGLTPSGTLKSLFISIDGVLFQIPASTVLS